MPSSVWIFSLVALATLALGLSIPEDDRAAWHDVKAWGAVALIAVLLTLAPVVKDQLSVTALRAGQVAIGGAAVLGFFWVLFVLPDISQNTSLAMTVGVVAGGVSAWLSTGRQSGRPPAPDEPPRW